MSNSDEVSSEDIIRIMVATDNHLGYGETDAVRGEDSFIAFEEILELAVEENVDFILLGGDLFHDAIPSQNALHKCMKLLRRYTFGDKPITMEFLSEQKLNFHNALNETVNYEDPNLNVSIPIFSIHGNHDDPSGFGRLSSLDLLSTTGLVNYFGRWTDLTHVNISPILLKKGESQLALYGLSHIHDTRLARLFENYKVTIQSPSEENGQWFHLMVLHQNRADRGPKNYIPEDLLPDFLNLVIWGHEHDCRIELEYNVKRGFYVCQPGSSVPTSLAEGEAIRKHVGILEIYKSTFKLQPYPLKTVRPFVFESINLSDFYEELRLDEGDVSNKVKKMAHERVLALIVQAKDQLTEHPRQPTLPLVRLRIIYSNEDQMFNAIRFGQTFNGRVANPADIVHFKKMSRFKTKNEMSDIDKEVIKNAFQKMELEDTTKVEDLVDRYFEEVQSKKPLNLLPSNALSEMSYRLVERRDNNAAENVIKFYKNKAIKHLMEVLPPKENIIELLKTLKNQISRDELIKEIEKHNSSAIVASISRKQLGSVSNDAAMNVCEGNKQLENDARKTTSRGRGKGGRSSVPGGRGRGTRAKHTIPELDVSINSTRTSDRNTILNVFNNEARTKRSSKTPVYVVSDDSD